MNLKRETIASVVESITNGINCSQNKKSIGVKISRIETIADRKINFKKTGFCKLNENDKKKYKLIKGDILFSHINSMKHIGKTAIYNGEEDLYHGVNLLKIKVKKHINPYYFKYFLETIFLSGYWKKNAKQAVNQASVNQKDIKKIDFFYPSLEEQKRIVAKLDAIFTEIEELYKLEEIKLKKNETYIQCLLDNIFKRNDNLCKLSDCAKINPPKKEVNNLDDTTEVSFMPMKDLGINNKLAVPNQNRKLKYVKGNYTYFSEGDVLLAKITPCFENGKIGIASNLLNGIGFGSSEYVVFRPNKNLKNDWLYYFLNRSSFRADGAQNMSGAVGHKRVNLDFIKNTLIPIPSKDEQEKILFNLKSLYSHSKAIKKIILKKKEEINLLKQSILKRLFSNKLADTT